MALTFPRISIVVDDDQGMGTQGELSTLSLGFGIHQAWIYTAMFGTTSIFNIPSPDFLINSPTPMISFVFLISIVTFGLSLLIAGITDQKFLEFYTAKRVLLASCLVTSLGTFAVFAAGAPGALGIAVTVFSGISTGVGSALLLLFWGTAYSRTSTATIVINTSVAIVIAVAIYSFVLHVIPTPFSGILTACLPLLELPLLWGLTPVSYAVRHAIPIFTALPVKKGPFSIRLALPVLLFGFALGALRSISTQIILPSSDLTTQLLALFAGGAATILLIITVFSIDKRSHWDFLFRPLIPCIAITLLFLPALALQDSILPPLILLSGYMCFEALMWMFFGEMSQEFRLSPIFLFGIGRGCLALGSLAGSLSIVDPTFLGSLTPFGEAGGAVLIMLVMVVAYALLPRVRDIKRAVGPRPSSEEPAIASFNRRVEQVRWENLHKGMVGDDAAEENSNEGAPLPHRATKTAGITPTITNATSGTIGWEQSFCGFEGTAHSAPSTTSFIANTTENSRPFRSDTSASRAPLAEPSTLSEAERSRERGRFRAQCETIADRYLLSRRETEVMFLLAKGHNAAYIQDKLCISKSTAKTHISHIYRKLDIHNQQELLGMVEEARDAW
ncbi:MAG: LuxR C-terminal-related transcriptional regulator [Gordonibacter sp.]|nr:LuxR C-terminal-related transcriptional regulator [Gordonibacter sp.]